MKMNLFLIKPCHCILALTIRSARPVGLLHNSWEHGPVYFSSCFPSLGDTAAVLHQNHFKIDTSKKQALASAYFFFLKNDLHSLEDFVHKDIFKVYKVLIILQYIVIQVQSLQE